MREHSVQSGKNCIFETIPNRSSPSPLFVFSIKDDFFGKKNKPIKRIKLKIQKNFIRFDKITPLERFPIICLSLFSIKKKDSSFFIKIKANCKNEENAKKFRSIKIAPFKRIPEPIVLLSLLSKLVSTTLPR